MRLSVNNTRLIKRLILIVFVFLFVFGMQTVFGSIARLITLFIIVFGVINYNKYFSEFPKDVFYLFVYLFFDLIVAFVVPCYLATYDFSIIPTKLNFIASLLATYLLAKYLVLNNYINENSFINLLLSVFLLQVIIILAMLLNSDFSEIITKFTRTGDQGQRVLDSYAGARGLGIADSSVFGLAIVMGLFILLSFFAYKNKIINIKYFTILLGLGTIAAVSAGRTALLGLLLGLLYLIVTITSKRSLFVLLASSIMFLLGIGFLLNVNQSAIENQTLSYLYSYVMEPFINYSQGGEFTTGSTDILQKMYFPLNEQQILIGDGKYMVGEQYYMSTDAGYMRFALFYGVFFSLLLYLYFIYFMIKVALKSKKNYFFVILLLIFSFILHYKGEVILFSISYNKLLFLILFFIYFDSQRVKVNYD